MEAAPDDAGAGLSARYFDGKTSRAYRVTLRVDGPLALVDGEVQRQCPLGELRLSERTVHAARKVTFPDGAYLEASDRAAFDALLRRTGFRDSWVVRAQQSWRGAALAAASSVAVLAGFYYFVLPGASDALARMLPLSVERKLGEGMLAMLDGRLLRPSNMPPARQRELVAAFSRMQAPYPGTPPYRILFRSSTIGPNAFALPSGDIIMTDEMVKLVPGDAAVMGVLAHELGHLHERHLTRRVIQGSAIAATTTVLFGDASALVANVPTLLLDLKYSRDTERAADAYAIAMLDKNGVAREHLAQAFLRMQDADEDDAPYLSSHPSSAERIAHIRSGKP